MTRVRRIAALALATGLTACDGSTAPVVPPPQPGWLIVELASPYDDDGGLVFAAAGGAIDSVRVSPAYAGIARRSDAGWQVLIVGEPLASGEVGAIHVPDVARAEDYRLTVGQAASRGAWTQRDPGAYALRLRAP